MQARHTVKQWLPSKYNLTCNHHSCSVSKNNSWSCLLPSFRNVKSLQMLQNIQGKPNVKITVLWTFGFRTILQCHTHFVVVESVMPEAGQGEPMISHHMHRPRYRVGWHCRHRDNLLNFKERPFSDYLSLLIQSSFQRNTDVSALLSEISKELCTNKIKWQRCHPLLVSSTEQE